MKNALSFRSFAVRRGQSKDLKAFQNYRVEFYEDLAIALEDGIAIATFLNNTEKRLKPTQPGAARIVSKISNNLIGEQLGDALKGLIPDSERIVIAAAEESGRLITELRFLAENAGNMSEMMSNAKWGMVMPAITLLISWANVALVCQGMLPMIEEMVPPERITGSTALFVNGSYVITYGSIPLGLAIFTTVYWVVKRLGTWRGPFRRKLDQVYPMSIYKDTQAAMLMMALGSMIRAGRGIKEGLSEISEKSSPWLRWHCNAMLNNLVMYPDKPGFAFNTGLLPDRIANRLIDLADSPEFATKLGDIGLSVVRQTNRRISVSAIRAELLIGVISSAILIGVSVGVPMIGESVMKSVVQ